MEPIIIGPQDVQVVLVASVPSQPVVDEALVYVDCYGGGGQATPGKKGIVDLTPNVAFIGKGG